MPTVADHLFDRTASDRVEDTLGKKRPQRPTQFGRKWNPRTPRAHITQIVGRLHVSVSDDDVRAEIQRRIDAARMRGPVNIWTASIVEQSLDFAVLVHHANQALFMRVMRGSR